MESIPSLTPHGFNRAIEALEAMRWRSEVKVEEIGSPQRIAPYSCALSAEFLDSEGEALSNGRLIMLHDPAGNEAWEGDFRIVSYIRASVELEMVADPLLPDVAWSWLTDALSSREAQYACLAGTVTASYGRGFGQMAEDSDRGEVERGSSWTPDSTEAAWFTAHLLAWQDLLGQVAGEPPLPAGVIRFPKL